MELQESALERSRVQTTPITLRPLTRELRAVGKIEFNESSIATVTTRVDGDVEKLFVDYTGVDIRAGDHLAEVYSPEPLVAQQELLIRLDGARNERGRSLVEPSKAKLARIGLTKKQIDRLVQNRESTDRATLYSRIRRTVIEKNIVLNSAFAAGDTLYRVANLDTVWGGMTVSWVTVFMMPCLFAAVEEHRFKRRQRQTSFDRQI